MLQTHGGKFAVEGDHGLVLAAPGVGATVVGVGPADESRLVAVVERRRSGPGHLDDYGLAHNGLVDAL